MNQIEINGKTYTLVTLDFETYYSKEYTLSGSLSMSEYIRHEEFKAHGVGILMNGKGGWYTGKNIQRVFNEMDWSDKAVIGHNMQFDGLIMSHHYGVVPAFYIDTLAMSRAVHGAHVKHDLDRLSKLHGRKGKARRVALEDIKGVRNLTKGQSDALGEYCLDDDDETLALFKVMYGHMPDEELELVHYTTRMFCDPVLRVDTPAVQDELEKSIGAKATAVLRTGHTPAELSGNLSFTKILKATGVEVPMKTSPTTGKEITAFSKTDLAFKELLHGENEKVANLCAARLAVKSTIGETRAMRFLEAGKNGMALPVALNYAGAHTLRWSGGNKMNLQNLVRKGALRRAIYAMRGWGLGVGDSAQIEARMIAWLAGQLNIVLAFANDEDVYKLMASKIYHKDVENVTDDERFIGKVLVLGLGFGMGFKKLRQTLAQGALGGKPVFVTEAESLRMVNTYRLENAMIVALWKIMQNIIHCMHRGIEGEYGPISYGKEYIRLPNGMFLHYAGLKRNEEGEYTYLTRNGFTKIYGGLLTENIVQALARCVIAEQWLATEGAGHRVVLSTHDELVICSPLQKIAAATDELLEIMSISPIWCPGLPLDSEGGWAANYSK